MLSRGTTGISALRVVTYLSSILVNGGSIPSLGF